MRVQNKTINDQVDVDVELSLVTKLGLGGSIAILSFYTLQEHPVFIQLMSGVSLLLVFGLPLAITMLTIKRLANEDL